MGLQSFGNLKHWSALLKAESIFKWNSLDQALQKGIEAHKAGKVHGVDRYYTAIPKLTLNILMLTTTWVS